VSEYTNEIRYHFDQHQVRLTFFDKKHRFEGPYASSTIEEMTEVASLVMTRQTFRAYLQILTQMANAMMPIGIPDPVDREPEPARDDRE
jgi:hypothetical protein